MCAWNVNEHVVLGASSVEDYGLIERIELENVPS